MSKNPPRRSCPVCRGTITDPRLDDGRAIVWHLENCLHDTGHEALHRLLGIPTCCETEGCDA